MRPASTRPVVRWRPGPIPVLFCAVAALASVGPVQGNTAMDDPKRGRVKIIEFVTDPVTCLSGLTEPEIRRVPRETLMPGNQPVDAWEEPRGYYQLEYTSDNPRKVCFVRRGAVRIQKNDAKPVGSCAPIVVAQSRGGGTRGASEGCR